MGGAVISRRSATRSLLPIRIMQRCTGPQSRKIKTDRRDVAALAEACRTGVYRHAHRASASARASRQRLRVRAHCVRQRTATINLLRAMVRGEGLRLPRGSAERVS